MFKKLYAKIDKIRSSLQNHIDDKYHNLTKFIVDQFDYYYKSNEREKNRMQETITSQQRTIEQLTNALKDKYEHGLFVLSEDCKSPMVIRNGKEITNEFTTYFNITWAQGEVPKIETEQMVGTFSGDEE